MTNHGRQRKRNEWSDSERGESIAVRSILQSFPKRQATLNYHALRHDKDISSKWNDGMLNTIWFHPRSRYSIWTAYFDVLRNKMWINVTRKSNCLGELNSPIWLHGTTSFVDFLFRYANW